MSANRNAHLRYHILDRCLKDWSSDFTIYDLQDAVNEVFCDLYGKEVSLRTIRKDIDDRPGQGTCHCPAGIFKNIISNVTKNEEAGHGLVLCPC